MPSGQLVLVEAKEVTTATIQDTREGGCELQRVASAEIHFPSVVRISGNTTDKLRLFQCADGSAHGEPRLSFFAPELMERNPRHILH